MNLSSKLAIIAVTLGAIIAPLTAATYTEDFEASFPTWESGWLGTNSNLQNIYGIGGYRGNNPDGLWIQDGLDLNNTTEITFGTVFGQSLASLSFDVATWDYLTIEIFDSSGATLGNWSMAPNYGAFTDPGTYVNFAATSSTGIGGFRFLGTSIEGNTSIDNVVASTDGQSVPDSAATAILVGLGLIASVSARRRLVA